MTRDAVACAAAGVGSALAGSLVMVAGLTGSLTRLTCHGNGTLWRAAATLRRAECDSPNTATNTREHGCCGEPLNEAADALALALEESLPEEDLTMMT